jgi:hypothetical protein
MRTELLLGAIPRRDADERRLLLGPVDRNGGCDSK